MFKKFGTNVKKYVDYLMTVNFVDLFINVVVLVCILLLSLFMFVPVGMVASLLGDFITFFIEGNVIISKVIQWISSLISTVLALFAFVYMFNKRFEDLEKFKEQVENKPQNKEKINAEDELDLPKAKDDK